MRTLGLTILLASLATAAAGAVDQPTYRSERAYLHCLDDNLRIHNVAAAPPGGEHVPWDTAAPDAAFLDSGAGCVVADPQLVPRAAVVGVDLVSDLDAQGTFTGNLRALTVQLHDLSPRATAGASQQELYVLLLVDGVVVVDTFVVTTSVEENSGATHKVEFSIDGLDIGNEPGSGAQRRDYYLSVRSSQGNVWAYDATEVPSGITFNPATLAAAQIHA